MPTSVADSSDGGWGCPWPFGSSRPSANAQLLEKSPSAPRSPLPAPQEVELRERTLGVWGHTEGKHGQGAWLSWVPNRKVKFRHDADAAAVQLPKKQRLKRPAPCMIEAVRNGQLWGFFSRGKITRTSEYGKYFVPNLGGVQLVDAETGQKLYYQTDHLEEQIDEEQKNKAEDGSNLYHITLWNHDVPSYHFWSVSEINSAERSTALYPSRTSEQKAKAKRAAAKDADALFKTRASMLAIPNSAGRKMPRSTRTTVKPPYATGSVEADEFRQWQAAYEHDLRERGVTTVLDELEEQYPEAVAYLQTGKATATYPKGARRPSNISADNKILWQPAHTLAYKLAQISMGLEVSPLTGAEEIGSDYSYASRVLTDDGDTSSWEWPPNPEAAASTEVITGARNKGKGRVADSSAVHRDPLHFLDYYNEKANGNIIIRTRNSQGGPQDVIQPTTSEHDQSHKSADKNFDSHLLSAQGSADLRTQSKNDSTEKSPIRVDDPSHPSDLAFAEAMANLRRRQQARLRPGSGHVLASSVSQELEKRLYAAENEVLQREEYCRICHETFRHGSNEIKAHYEKHRSVEEGTTGTEKTSTMDSSNLLAPSPLADQPGPGAALPSPPESLVPWFKRDQNSFSEWSKTKPGYLNADIADRVSKWVISDKSRSNILPTSRTASCKRKKNLLEADMKIGSFCNSLDLPSTVADQAKHIFKSADGSDMLKGRSWEAIIASCIFIACRQNGVPRTFQQIHQLTQVSKKDIGQAFKQLDLFLSKQHRTVKQTESKRSPPDETPAPPAKKARKAKAAKVPDPTYKDGPASASEPSSPNLPKPRKSKGPRHLDATYKDRPRSESETPSPILPKPKKLKGAKHPDATYKDQPAVQSDTPSPILRKAPKRKAAGDPDASYRKPAVETESETEHVFVINRGKKLDEVDKHSSKRNSTWKPKGPDAKVVNEVVQWTNDDSVFDLARPSAPPGDPAPSAVSKAGLSSPSKTKKSTTTSSRVTRRTKITKPKATAKASKVVRRRASWKPAAIARPLRSPGSSSTVSVVITKPTAGNGSARSGRTYLNVENPIASDRVRRSREPSPEDRSGVKVSM